MAVAIEQNAPGVTALVNQGQVSRPLQRATTSTFFALGFAEWGPIGVATRVTSFQDFVRNFGGFRGDSFLAESAYTFFNFFGGKQMFVCRAGDSEQNYGAFNLKDRVGNPPSGNNIAVGAVPAELRFGFRTKYVTKSVDILITTEDEMDGLTSKLTIESKSLKIKEIYRGVSGFNELDMRQKLEKSQLVELSFVDGRTTPDASIKPKYRFEVVTKKPIPFGDDGATDFSFTASANQLLSAFDDESFGDGQIAAPGITDLAFQNALIAHAAKYQRFALLEIPLGSSVNAAVSYVNAGLSRDAHAAIYYPWVQLAAIDGSNLKKLYPPSMFAAGVCAQVDRTTGTHKAPANIAIPNALDVERNPDGTTLIDDNVRAVLNENNINAIAPIRGEGIKIYGARTLAPISDTRVLFVHEQRILNLIYYTAKIGFGYAVFATVDGGGRLFRDLKASATNFLRGLYNDGALYGKTEKDAFTVVCDETNNPPSELEQGRVHVQIGVKLSPTAEQIIINIDNVPLSQDLNVLNGGAN